MPLDLKALRHVKALGKHGNFARAAEELGLTQPALSRSIAELERILGVQLFDRSKSGAYPTAFGRMVLERGQDLLDGAAELEREVQLMSGLEVGTLVVAAGVFATQVSLAMAAAQLMARHPGLSIRILSPSERSIMPQVESKLADFALADLAWAEASSALVCRPLPEHPAVLVCRPGHPLTAIANPSPEQIFSYPVAGPLCPPRIGDHLRGFPVAGSVEPGTGDFVPRFCSSGPIDAWLAIVGCSDAIAALPPTLALPRIAAGEIAALPVELPWATIRYGFVYLRDRSLSPAARALMEAARAIELENRDLYASRSWLRR